MYLRVLPVQKKTLSKIKTDKPIVRVYYVYDFIKKKFRWK